MVFFYHDEPASHLQRNRVESLPIGLGLADEVSGDGRIESGLEEGFDVVCDFGVG